ncbi:MAG: hypothetical protein GXO90_03660 [FCB group bacterium]|nr:hypothetical protein [FCB group bacterium]
MKRAKMNTFNGIILLFSLTIISSCTDQKDDSFTIVYSGGGFTGGINPTFTETIISNSGKVVINTTSLYTDDVTQVRYTNEREVNNLYQYIMDNGFMDLNDVYDCADNDSICVDLKIDYPPANPLTITLDENDITHSVTVSVYNCTESPIIDYPAILDSIVNKISETIASSE